MSGIEDHRAAQGPELGQAAVVHHQGVVAKAGAPLGKPEPDAVGLQTAFRQLAHHLGHIPGSQEQPLLHIRHLAGAGHGLGGSLERPSSFRVTMLVSIVAKAAAGSAR